MNYINSDSLVQVLLNETLAGFWDWNISKERVFISRGLCASLGLSSEDREAHPDFLWSRIHPDDLNHIRSSLSEYIKQKGRDVLQLEVRYLREDREEVWFWCSSRAIEWDESGYPTRIAGTHVDFTQHALLDKKRTQDTELWKKQTLRTFEKTNEVAKIGYWSVDLESNMVYWSKITRQIHELPESLPDVNPVDWAIGFYKDDKDKDRISRFVQKLIEEGTSFDDTFQIRTYSGKDRWVRAIGLREIDPFGKIRVFGTFQDVDHEMQLLLELQNKSEQLDLVLQGSSEGWWDWDYQKGEIFYSASWFEMLGFDQNETSSDPSLWVDLLHPNDRELTMPHLNALLDDPEVYNIKLEFRFRHKEGHYFPVIARGIVKRGENGQVIRLTGSTYDLSTIRDAEEKVSEQRNQLRTIIDLIPGYIFIKDRDGRFVLANQPLADVLGKSPDELIGLRDEDLGATPEISEEYRKMDLKVIESGKPHFIREELVIRKDGSYGWFQTSKIPFRAGFGHHETMILGVSIDISERKKLEEELTQARIQADQANRAKSEFLANMSHEIRTPLNGVIGFSELLENTDLNALQKEYMQNVTISAHTLLDLINDILDFSKIEAGKLELDPSRTNLFDLLQRSAEVVSFAAKKKNLGFNVNIDPNLPRFVTVDASRLRQVILNLLSNAVKFTESGRVELSAEVLDYVEGTEKVSMVISISDSGIGISDENQKRIFKAFQQADSSIRKKYGGTGLGLVISNRILQKMDTHIQLVSHEGEGSTFYFRLEIPIEKEQLPSENISKNRSKPELDALSSKVVVLIAEDSPINMMLAKTLVRKFIQNVEIIEAENGQKAVEKYRDYLPQIVLMDIQMPEMDGYQASREIRAIETELNLNRIPILAVTAGAIVGERERCLAAGMDDYITKPINQNELQECINEWLMVSQTK